MLAYYKVVFDEVISGTTSVFSGSDFYDELGLYDQITLQGVADNATVANTLTVDLQHSADGIWWLAETASILSGSVTASTSNFFFGTCSDNATQQGAALRRLKVTLSVASAVHVKIYALAHDESVRDALAGMRGVSP